MLVRNVSRMAVCPMSGMVTQGLATGAQQVASMSTTAVHRTLPPTNATQVNGNGCPFLAHSSSHLTAAQLPPVCTIIIVNTIAKKSDDAIRKQNLRLMTSLPLLVIHVI
jgi:hypothetical protein